MDNNGFSYSYSAKDQAEIKKIREKYTVKKDENENKLARLRRLDAGVIEKAQIVSLVFGIVGALILGSGMSLILSDLWQTLGLTRTWSLIIGIPLGVLGGVLASFAYPMYQIVERHERERVAPEILKLTDELMK